MLVLDASAAEFAREYACADAKTWPRVMKAIAQFASPCTLLYTLAADARFKPPQWELTQCLPRSHRRLAAKARPLAGAETS